MTAAPTPQPLPAPTAHKVVGALWLAGLGLRLHPLRPRSKAPARKGWQRDATTDPAAIRKWFGDGRAEIGICTATVLVVDVDGAEGRASLAALEAQHGAIPPTLRVRTGGGGEHIYFARGPLARVANSVQRLAPKIDVRADGRDGPGNVVGPWSVHASGARYEVVEAAPIAQPPAWLVELLRGLERELAPEPAPVSRAIAAPDVLERARRYARTLDPAISGAGGHAATFAAAQKIVRGFDLGVEDAYEILAAEFNPRCQPPWSPAELRRKVQEADAKGSMPRGERARAERPHLRAVRPTQASAGSAPSRPSRPSRPPTSAADRTDLGNADRFVAAQRATLRHVGAWGKWLAWDGRRWGTDVTGVADARAKDVVRAMFDEASGAFSPDDSEAKKDLAWALESHEARRLAALVKLARSAPELAVRVEELDADPWLLTVANGVVDLRTGELAPHDPARLTTKLASVAYDPAARCPTWDRFLDRAMGGSSALVDYLARMVGYSLTGVIREHVLAFLFGGGANGKSTFLRVLHALLGDYSVRASRGLLFVARGERHPTELTVLHGARVATCAEIQAGDYFDEALVKDLTGGDLVSARRMREDFWTFEPSHKLWLAGNHKPRVRGDDEGIWRRIRLVPWEVTIPDAERDPELVDKLLEELPGILAWAVRGCLAWQRGGLGDPAAVTRATATYRDEADPLREFCERWLVFAPGEIAPRKHLRAAYEEYCRDDGAEPLGARRFAEGLRRRGATDATVKLHGKVLDAWRGVRLATDAERDTDRPGGLASAPPAVGSRDLVGTNTIIPPIRAPIGGNRELPPTKSLLPTAVAWDDPDERTAIIEEGAPS